MSSIPAANSDVSRVGGKGFWSRMSFRGSSAATSSSSVGGPSVGGAGNRFGTVISLCGCLADVTIYMEPLLDTQVQAIYKLGMLIRVQFIE